MKLNVLRRAVDAGAEVQVRLTKEEFSTLFNVLVRLEDAQLKQLGISGDMRLSMLNYVGKDMTKWGGYEDMPDRLMVTAPKSEWITMKVVIDSLVPATESQGEEFENIKATIMGTLRDLERETPSERLKRISSLAPEAIAKLGELMENSSEFILPASRLPLQKEEMKIALQMAWSSTKNEQLRNSLETSYAMLSLFQEGIEKPITLMHQDEVDPREFAETIGTFETIWEKVDKETETLLAEFKEFKKRHITQPARQAHPKPSWSPHPSTRGEIDICPEGRSKITLFEGADYSTLTHLTAQDDLKQLRRYAQYPDAPQQLRDDLKTVIAWLGVSDEQNLQKEHYERFARGYAAWLREGNAPSPQLTEIFLKSKQWLTESYPDGLGSDIVLTTEIRAVFARMHT